MARVGKILIGTGIGAGLLYLLTNLLGKKKLGDKLDTLTTAMIHSLDLKGLTVRIDVVLNNPTEYTLRIRQPYVRLLVEDKLVGNSQVENQEIEIKPYAAVRLNSPIYITVPLTGLLSVGGTFYRALKAQQPVNIKVDTMTSIDLGGRWVGYQKQDTIALKPKLPAKPKASSNAKPDVKRK